MEGLLARCERGAERFEEEEEVESALDHLRHELNGNKSAERLDAELAAARQALARIDGDLPRIEAVDVVHDR